MLGELLLIEDEDDIRELIVEKLRAGGYPLNIYDTGNPATALDLFHKNKSKITTVICDYYLPIQNGNDLCQIIKENKPSVVIYCLTGGAFKDDNSFSGIDKVFYKPEGIDQVVAEALMTR